MERRLSILERINEHVVEYFLSEPQRLIDTGMTALYLGMGQCLAGLFGQLLLQATGVMARLGGQQVERSLDQMFPDFPTWWIPEGWVGFLFPLVIAVLGFWMAKTGKHYKRFVDFY